MATDAQKAAAKEIGTVSLDGGTVLEDCIKVIADYVIGTVIYSDIRDNNDDVCMIDVSKIEKVVNSNDINDRKRKIENNDKHDSLPLSKRRRLN